MLPIILQMTGRTQSPQVFGPAVLFYVVVMRHGQGAPVGVKRLPRASALFPAALTLPVRLLLDRQGNIRPIIRIF